ncbi:MAG: hypothetical protein WCY49_03380 [Anaerovoracaceae bacterium]|jgi:flagellar basal body-associated protein FliL|nr:hypothetical protein [Clostridiales bacterium]
MKAAKKLDEVMPKTGKGSSAKALGLFSVLLAIPTVIYMLLVSRKEKEKEAGY